MPVSSIIPT